ncbi:MAG: OmpP1/FadL family transporter [Pseudomonadota bacterium]
MRRTTLSKALLSVSALALGVALSPLSAEAAGFYVQEVSSSSAGASNAGAAAMPRDASIIFHNPSAMTQLDGAQVNGAVHALFTHSELEDRGSTIGGGAASALGFGNDGGNPGGLNTIPNLYGAMPVGYDDRLWIGLGITSPFGLGPDYDDNFFGSFLVREAQLRVIDFTPSVSYKVNDLFSLGVSAIIQKADLNYKFNTGLAQVTRVDADDVATGYKLSATITPDDDWTIGLQYRSGTNLDFDGDIGVNAAAGTASGTLNLPDIATLGVSYKVDEQWTVMGGVEWFGWNETDVATIENSLTTDLPVSFLYENTINVSLGAEHTYNDKWTFRAGYQYDETPTTAQARSPLNPDGNRHWFSGGATQTLDEHWSIDYAATYINIADGNFDRTIAAGTRVAGQAQNYALIGTIGVNYKF